MTVMPSGFKRPTNVSIDANLVSRAKELGINLSETLETRLRELVQAAEQAAWQEQNKEAIESYNQRIAEYGVFGEDERVW